MEKNWWKEAVAYQVYPRSFNDSNNDGIGDLPGMVEKLDYLKDLGIDVIWLSPMYKSPNDDNGYDISDYQDIMEEFGTMEDFNHLLSETHKRGMKLILDLVVNHTSDEHPWFIESRSSKDNPKRDWYIWADPKSDGSEPNNWESIFNGSTWEYDDTTKQYYFHLFSKKQPDLNWSNPDVREAVFKMMNWWFEKGIDGFRVDAITHIKKTFEAGDLPVPKGKQYAPAFDVDMNQPGIQDWLQEMKDKSLSHYDIMTVGEANGVNPDNAKEWVGEKEGKFNMIFQFEHLGLWSTGDSKFDVLSYKNVLNRWQKQLEGIGWNALFIENHDQPRRVSTWGDDTKYWFESATSHAVVYFLQQGTPFIYQGQEIGMTNYPFESIETFNDVAVKTEYQIVKSQGGDVNQLLDKYKMENRDNSRTPMQWTNEVNGGFTEGTPWFPVNPNYKTINVAQQSEDSDSVLNFYKRLIKLKKSDDIYTYGEFNLIDDENENIFAYTRKLNNKTVLVAGNLTDHVASLNLPFEVEASQIKLHNYKNDLDITNMKPFEAFVAEL
ncbi:MULTISPECIES: glycoside hydrolase family 13 protein [Staphylococcus]|jgi:alpha-glucosidase|uniref:Alpha-amylase n=5 Tax=Bacillales TaxID=1385 RepID=A0A8X8GVR4_STAHO|nr:MULTISPECIES: alpha-glucosidase [Staphylococcus]EUZ70430.1 alpha glucosidase [Staphylococcus sp. M0480]OFM56898.1 glucohydrolase [Staphylococcus sp. HMSC059G05]OFM61826.1 glucohydrolase [Staphylococcus sp. HMSC062C01]OFM77143.1 glucohydrolase [Staphylococcus sp. HMSC074B09]OFM91085.1 glucohydrolase [Staphylococcus sp. HMSC078D05]OFR37503.1 glucohydrolase [Staphylococcus sp. HMSC063F02]OFS48909.1 glucohydrolase [Staphylococcus sp. HMSC075H09]OHO59129.1 glucohydrolase [Staphylococcus sp. H